MQQPVFKPLTAQDYFDLPEDGRLYQLIDGDLHMSPSPSTRHQRILRRIFAALTNHIEEHAAGEVFPAPFDVQLSDIDVLQPDICYYSADRLGCITDQGARGAPDLVVEILSPRTEKFDRGPKLRKYGLAGVQELWMVDPDANTLALYRFQQSAEPIATLHPSDVVQTPLFEGLVISLEEVFA